MSDDQHTVVIDGRTVGPGHPAYVIAEISANHNQDLSRAIELVQAAHAAGADAVKLQTYTPDTLTIACDADPFRIRGGTLWDGRTLYELYAEAMMPWEWHEPILAEARRLGITWLSSPFDASAVQFLDDLAVPALKIASFELVDLELIAAAASTGRPLIMSTGMAEEDEIDLAVRTARAHGGGAGLVLLHCNSGYPAPAEEMHLRTVAHMAARWGCPTGLSDHTLGIAASIAAVAVGACVIEKHVTLRRSDGGPDSAFSLEPHELQELVRSVRFVESALGSVRYGPSDRERASLAFRRSIFAVEDIAAGEPFTRANVRVIRPGQGLAPLHLPEVLAARASAAIRRGTPISWDLVSS